MPALRNLVKRIPLVRDNAELKKSLKALANRVGGIYELPLDEFFVDRRALPDRHGDACSDLFYGYAGPGLVNKWGHYLPIYSRLFGPFRDRTGHGRPLRFLEIGVSKGGSLDIWRDYFGEEAIIYGVDIDPGCAGFDGRSAQVRIGSQADPDFLRSVVDEMGGVDIVLDDGSHVAEHQRIAFETLFPRLSPDGLYVVEDLHCAYWTAFGGGFRRKTSFISIAKDLIDDMHHWYHRRPRRYETVDVGAVHVYDSLIALEKAIPRKPFHTTVGSPGLEIRP
jgi:hypothetical protein